MQNRKNTGVQYHYFFKDYCLEFKLTLGCFLKLSAEKIFILYKENMKIYKFNK